MKNIQIKASLFFDLLKTRDTSMWEIFSQMIDGEEKEIVFLDDDGKMLFNYALPATQEELETDQKKFAKEYAEKLTQQ
ncbi:MAG: hypothetical protein ITF99_04010 [Chryseobacterium sp.]|nr:hypothetical protein [Chryseobacterium sp.]